MTGYIRQHTCDSHSSHSNASLPQQRACFWCQTLRVEIYSHESHNRIHPNFINTKTCRKPQKIPFSPLIDLFPFLQVVLQSPTTCLSIQSSSQATGHNFSALQDQLIPAHSKALIDIGISFMVPLGTYSCIAPHSSLAAKYIIDVGTGVINEDYTGLVKVLLFNHRDTNF